MSEINWFDKAADDAVHSGGGSADWGTGGRAHAEASK
jgi:hypothetical protein